MEVIIEFIKNFNMEVLINLILSICVFLLFYMLRSAFAYIIIKIIHRNIKDAKEIRKKSFYKPLEIFFATLGIYLGVYNFGIATEFVPYLNKIFRIVVICLASSGISNSLNPNSAIFKQANKKINFSKGNTVLLFLCKLGKVLVYILAAVLIISELGYDINGLIAGIGLSGLTVALGSQDTASNIFGGIVIIFDKCFAIGDWIKTGETEGIVEEITFRSTRIRTFENTIVSIPNSKIVSEAVTNCSDIQKRRCLMNIIITLDTPLKNMSKAIEDIKEMLYSDDDINKEVIRVNFLSIEDSGYKVQIVYYTNVTKYDEYLAIIEKINFQIVKIFEAEKVEMAYPTQTIYTKK